MRGWTIDVLKVMLKWNISKIHWIACFEKFFDSDSLKLSGFSLALFLFPLSDNGSKQFEVLIRLLVGIFPYSAYLFGFTKWLEFIGLHPFLVAGMHSILVVDSRLLCVVQGTSYLWLCSLLTTKVIFSSSCKSLMINWADLSSFKASLSWSELKTRL